LIVRSPGLILGVSWLYSTGYRVVGRAHNYLFKINSL
jgi:hypothetical protein